MNKKPAVMLLEKPGEINNYSQGIKTVCFELDIFGQPAYFNIGVAQKQIRLSDIVPLARKLSKKLALIVLDKLRKNGEVIPCRKGCSACCNYLTPLSVPEAFRLREEIMALPASQQRKVVKSCLDTAKIILNKKPEEFEITESSEANSQTQINQLSKWYASFKLECPFLSDNLCTFYESRPIACREHIVTGSSRFCEDEWLINDALRPIWQTRSESQIVQMPVSVLNCLGQLAAELEHSEIEAVMLPLVLPWVQDNFERGERRWPAAQIVECFVEILLENNSRQSREITTNLQPTFQY
jgi:Fe-S-cluster containining protein